MSKHTNSSKVLLSSSYLVPVSIIAGSILISLSLLLSSGIVKIKTGNPVVQAPTQPSKQTVEITAKENTGSIKISLDDDPILGDKNAPVTLVEFSDYECPFCKKYFSETYPQIKREYIDTGKVKLIFRDLPLPFHDPMATKEAIAANCAREQGGDIVYFKYHDEIFKRTTSNGNGLAIDDLYTIASDLALNSGNFKICLDSNKYKDEVSEDLSDASKYGASGTPTFFIGKSIGPEINGTKLVGAQPYSAFKIIIDQQLK